MSRKFGSRTKQVRSGIGFLFPKKKSKVDQALSIAKSNKSKLASAIEVVLGKATTAGDVFNSTPIVDYLSPLTGMNGFKAKIRSVRVKGTIKQNLASALADDWRVDLVLDRRPDGAEVTPLELYGSATPSIGDFKNHNFKSRFRILRSAFGVFESQGPTSATIDWYVKLNIITETVATGSWAIASVLKNAIFLVYWTTAVANQPIPRLETAVYADDQ